MQEDSGRLFQTRVSASDDPRIAASDYRLWLPRDAKTIRCVIVINQRGAGKRLFFKDARWREMARDNDAAMLYCEFEAKGVRDNGYGESILKACEQFAVQLDRDEIKHAPFLLWGHSMGGRVSQDFARFKPGRVLAYIIAMRAHPSEPGMMEEEEEAMRVPALYVMGEEDGKPGDIYAHYARARENGSPRAWVWAPGQEHWPRGMGHGADHTSDEDWNAWAANDVVLPWAEAVLQRRLPEDADARAGPVQLRPLRLKDGWLGHIDTGEVAVFDAGSAGDHHLSWFPTKRVAEAWADFTHARQSGCVCSHRIR